MPEIFKYLEPFQLENGEVLPELEVSYTTLGKLNKEKSNVIWVCHALTANAQPEDWWKGLIGKEKGIDMEKYFYSVRQHYRFLLWKY